VLRAGCHIAPDRATNTCQPGKAWYWVCTGDGPIEAVIPPSTAISAPTRGVRGSKETCDRCSFLRAAQTVAWHQAGNRLMSARMTSGRDPARSNLPVSAGPVVTLGNSYVRCSTALPVNGRCSKRCATSPLSCQDASTSIGVRNCCLATSCASQARSSEAARRCNSTYILNP